MPLELSGQGDRKSVLRRFGEMGQVLIIGGGDREEVRLTQDNDLVAPRGWNPRSPLWGTPLIPRLTGIVIMAIVVTPPPPARVIGRPRPGPEAEESLPPSKPLYLSPLWSPHSPP